MHVYARRSLRPGFLALGILAVLALAAPAGRAQAQDKVYSPNELSSPPAVKSKSAAAAAIEKSLPSSLAAVGGKVQLRFIVGPDGQVEPGSVEVLAATASSLGEAAKKAVQKIAFVPATAEGKPVRAHVVFPVVYAAN